VLSIEPPSVITMSASGLNTLLIALSTVSAELRTVP